MEKIPNIKPWDGCKHPTTRKLYFQRRGKWVTTEISICEDCPALIHTKKEELK